MSYFRPPVLVTLAHLFVRGRHPGRPPEPAEIEPLLQRAIAIWEQAVDQDPHSWMNAVDQLARHHEQQGRFDEAEALCQRAAALGVQKWGPAHPFITQPLSTLAGLYERQGRLQDAEALLQEVVSRHEQVGGPNHPAESGPLHDLARFQYARRRCAEAEATVRRCLAISENDPHRHSSQLVSDLHQLADLCMAQKKYEEAEALLQRALSVLEVLPEAERGIDPLLSHSYAALLKLTGRLPEALAMYKRAEGLFPHGHDQAAEARRLVVSPPPYPDEAAGFVWITTFTVGHVTEESAQLHWQCTADAHAVSVYHAQGRGGGGYGIGRDNIHPLDLAAPCTWADAEAFAVSTGGADYVTAAFVPAEATRAGGSPRIEMESRVRTLGRPDFAEVEVRFANRGDGEALKLRVEQLSLAKGWELLGDWVGGEPLPKPLDVGRIGPGGVGVFITRIVRRLGATQAALVVHGTFTDPSGARLLF